MKFMHFLFISIIAILLVACGGGESSDGLPEIYTVNDLNISASSSNAVVGQLSDSEGNTDGFEFSIVNNPSGGQVILSADGTFVYTPNENMQGNDEFTFRISNAQGQSNIGVVRIEITIVSACLDTRETLLSTEFLVNQNQSAILTTLGDKQDVSGFVTEQEAYSNAADARTMLSNVISRITGNGNVISTISERKTLANIDSFSGQYRLTRQFSTNISSVDLRNSLYQSITGRFDDQMPEVNADAIESTDFRLWITVIYNDENSVMIVLALVANESLEEFSAILDAYADGGNIALCGSEITSTVDQFTATEVTTNLADFLFVVDNSGSMDGEQQAVKEAADLFVTTIENANLNFEIGVITTDNGNLRGNGFTNDVEQFKIDVVAGIFGSGLETGIYFAERALLSEQEGDATDGTVTNANYPRQDASFSVIILSDEPSQYNSRASTSFDADNNLFVERGYRVYSIVNERDASRSQYDDLAFATGGSVASISDTTTFPEIMEQIANNAGGASSSYILSEKPISSTIQVIVNGNQIIRSRENGWRYIPLSNSIVFYGDAIPESNATILIEYTTIIEPESSEDS